MSRSPVVEMRAVHKRFGGVQAVRDVTLSLHAGEIVGLLGHNGTGKSTLIQLLSGALELDAGSILVDGAPVRMRSPRDARRRGIETLYQDLALADNLDAVANLFLGRELTNRWGLLDDSAMERAARAVIQRLNPQFPDLASPVAKLSGGQRQTVALARAVHFHARVLILDEPTAALGPQESRLVTDAILQCRRDGLALLLVTHDLDDVFELSDRVVIMRSGRIVAERRSADITRDEALQLIIAGRAQSDGDVTPG